jgi:hypothetical protein
MPRSSAPSKQPKQTPFAQIPSRAVGPTLQTQNVNGTPQLNKSTATGPSLLQTVKEGFAFGVGSAVARTAVDSLFSGNSKSKVPEPQQPVTGTDSCKHLLESYESCLRLSSQDTTCSNEILSYIQCVHRGETPSKPDAPQ